MLGFALMNGRVLQKHVTPNLICDPKKFPRESIFEKIT